MVWEWKVIRSVSNVNPFPAVRWQLVTALRKCYWLMVWEWKVIRSISNVNPLPAVRWQLVTALRKVLLVEMDGFGMECSSISLLVSRRAWGGASCGCCSGRDCLEVSLVLKKQCWDIVPTRLAKMA